MRGYSTPYRGRNASSAQPGQRVASRAPSTGFAQFFSPYTRKYDGEVAFTAAKLVRYTLPLATVGELNLAKFPTLFPASAVLSHRSFDTSSASSATNAPRAMLCQASPFVTIDAHRIALPAVVPFDEIVNMAPGCGGVPLGPPEKVL